MPGRKATSLSSYLSLGSPNGWPLSNPPCLHDRMVGTQSTAVPLVSFNRARDHGKHQSSISYCPGHRPDMIKRFDEWKNTVATQTTPSGLQTPPWNGPSSKTEKEKTPHKIPHSRLPKRGRSLHEMSRKPSKIKCLELAPRAGFEPATRRLTADCRAPFSHGIRWYSIRLKPFSPKGFLHFTP